MYLNIFREKELAKVTIKKEDLERALVVLKKALEAYPGRVDEGSM